MVREMPLIKSLFEKKYVEHLTARSLQVSQLVAPGQTEDWIYYDPEQGLGFPVKRFGSSLGDVIDRQTLVAQLSAVSLNYSTHKSDLAAFGVFFGRESGSNISGTASPSSYQNIPYAELEGLWEALVHICCETDHSGRSKLCPGLRQVIILTESNNLRDAIVRCDVASMEELSGFFGDPDDNDYPMLLDDISLQIHRLNDLNVSVKLCVVAPDFVRDSEVLAQTALMRRVDPQELMGLSDPESGSTEGIYCNSRSGKLASFIPLKRYFEEVEEYRRLETLSKIKSQSDWSSSASTLSDSDSSSFEDDQVTFDDDVVMINTNYGLVEKGVSGTYGNTGGTTMLGSVRDRFRVEDLKSSSSKHQADEDLQTIMYRRDVLWDGIPMVVQSVDEDIDPELLAIQVGYESELEL